MPRKLDKKTIEKLLLDSELLPPPVRRVLELRQGGAQAAVKKIDALLARAGDDDRIRGAFRLSRRSYWSRKRSRISAAESQAYHPQEGRARRCHRRGRDRRLRACARALRAAARHRG